MEIIRRDNELPTLRISLGRTGGGQPEAVFDTASGESDPTEAARCPTTDLGLPEQGCDLTRIQDDAFGIPRAIRHALRRAVATLPASPLPPTNALWLELAEPRGHLHLLPWEALLSFVDRPIFRLPDHLVRPHAGRTLEIAICASVPAHKAKFRADERVDCMARTWMESSGHETKLHLFVDLPAYENLVRRVADLGPAVVVHQPENAGRTWLQWIDDALGGRALDILQFVAHGYLSGGRGRVALAKTPVHDPQRPGSRLIGAPEISAFLGRVGAWGLVLSAPDRNYSPIGLRALADAVALARPGVTLVDEPWRRKLPGVVVDKLRSSRHHELARSDLTPGVAVVFAGERADVRPMPGLTCWAHPRFADFATPDDDEGAGGEASTWLPPGDPALLTSAGSSSLVNEPLQSLLSSDATPAWIASGARFLETQQAQWMPSVAGEAVDPDAVQALQAVSNLLGRHAHALQTDRENPA